MQIVSWTRQNFTCKSRGLQLASFGRNSIRNHSWESWVFYWCKCLYFKIRIMYSNVKDTQIATGRRKMCTAIHLSSRSGLCQTTVYCVKRPENCAHDFKENIASIFYWDWGNLWRWLSSAGSDLDFCCGFSSVSAAWEWRLEPPTRLLLCPADCFCPYKTCRGCPSLTVPVSALSFVEWNFLSPSAARQWRLGYRQRGARGLGRLGPVLAGHSGRRLVTR